MAPGVAGSTRAPVVRSTARKTMLPGGVNSGRSLRSPIHAFMTSSHTGSAAAAPLSPGPSVFFLSWPIQTPIVTSGSKPTNHASVKSSVVPVFPATGQSSDAARAAVPRSRDARSRLVITNAVSARSASAGDGRFSSSTFPCRSTMRWTSNGIMRTPWFGNTAKALSSPRAASPRSTRAPTTETAAPSTRIRAVRHS